MATLEEQVKELTERVEKLERKLGMAPLRDFKGLITGLDSLTLQQIFQGESERSLATALMGQPQETLERARKALSKTRWHQVHAEMRDLTGEGVTEESVKGAQEEIQRKMQNLEAMAGIGVPGRPEAVKLDLKEWTAKVLEPLAG